MTSYFFVERARKWKYIEFNRDKRNRTMYGEIEGVRNRGTIGENDLAIEGIIARKRYRQN